LSISKGYLLMCSISNNNKKSKKIVISKTIQDMMEYINKYLYSQIKQEN
jgi:hypothetical protein